MNTKDIKIFESQLQDKYNEAIKRFNKGDSTLVRMWSGSYLKCLSDGRVWEFKKVVDTGGGLEGWWIATDYNNPHIYSDPLPTLKRLVESLY